MEHAFADKMGEESRGPENDAKAENAPPLIPVDRENKRQAAPDPASTDDQVAEDERPLVAPVAKRRRTDNPEELRRQVAKKMMEVELPPFGTNREFATLADFLVAYADYTNTHSFTVRQRSTSLRDTESRRILDRHAACTGRSNCDGSDEAEDINAPHQIPEHLSHYQIVAWCRHGCIQKPRGKGRRKRARGGRVRRVLQRGPCGNRVANGLP